MKSRILLLLCLIIILLSSCTPKLPIENEKFSIYEENGKYYMEFYTDVQDKDLLESEIGGMLVARYPSYSSVSEMQKGILAGNFTDREVSTLRYRSMNNTFQICDPYNLYDLMLPEGVSYDTVEWQGDLYLFNILEDIYGFIYCASDDSEYSSWFEQNYSNFINEKCQVISDQVEEDRSARVVHYMTGSGEFVTKSYPVTTPGGIIYVTEDYALNWFETALFPDRPTSKTVPYTVYISGTEDGWYYYGMLKGFTERPSVEWFLSFGLEPLSD